MRITDASKLTTRGLRVLRDHNISDLEARGLARATITDLIGSLGDWTVANVRTFNVAESTFLVRESLANYWHFHGCHTHFRMPTSTPSWCPCPGSKASPHS